MTNSTERQQLTEVAESLLRTTARVLHRLNHDALAVEVSDLIGKLRHASDGGGDDS